MTKAELIDKVAAKSGLTKKDSGKAIDALFESITEAMASGEKVQLVGFGTFVMRKRAQRTGRNPQTGEEMTIPARKVPTFRPGKALKDAIEK